MSEQGLYFEGLAMSFDWDRDGERFLDAGLDDAIERFKANPQLVWSHQKARDESGMSFVTLGAVTEIERRADGIHIVGYVPKPEPGTFLADVYRKLRESIYRGLSIGGRWLRAGAGDLKVLDLSEVSLASIPVNPKTLIRRVWPATEAPAFAPALAGAIGTEGKAAAGTFDLNLAMNDPLAEFAAALRGLRGELAVRKQADFISAREELRRTVAAVRPWTP